MNVRKQKNLKVILKVCYNLMVWVGSFAPLLTLYVVLRSVQVVSPHTPKFSDIKERSLTLAKRWVYKINALLNFLLHHFSMPSKTCHEICSHSYIVAFGQSQTPPLHFPIIKLVCSDTTSSALVLEKELKCQKVGQN